MVGVGTNGNRGTECIRIYIMSDFPWILEFLNFEHTDRKRELSGPRPLRGVQVDSSKSTI